MEELKLILAALAQLGDAGKEAFIWWLVFDKGLMFAGLMVGLAVFAYAVRRMTRDEYRAVEIATAVARASGAPEWNHRDGPLFRACMAWVEQHRPK